MDEVGSCCSNPSLSLILPSVSSNKPKTSDLESPSATRVRYVKTSFGSIDPHRSNSCQVFLVHMTGTYISGTPNRRISLSVNAR